MITSKSNSGEIKRLDAFIRTHIIQKYGLVGEKNMFLVGEIPNNHGLFSERKVDLFVSDTKDDSFNGWSDIGIVTRIGGELLIGGHKSKHDEIYWKKAEEYGISEKLKFLLDHNYDIDEIYEVLEWPLICIVNKYTGEISHRYWLKAEKLCLEYELKKWDCITHIGEVGGGYVLEGLKNNMWTLYWSKAIARGIDEEIAEWNHCVGYKASGLPITFPEHAQEIGGGLAFIGEKNHPRQIYWSKAKKQGIEEELKKWKNVELLTDVGGGLAFIGKKNGYRHIYWSKAKEKGISTELKNLFLPNDTVKMNSTRGKIKETLCDLLGGVLYIIEYEGKRKICYWSRAEEFGLKDELKKWDVMCIEPFRRGVLLSGKKDGIIQLMITNKYKKEV
ncbi:hypothetical protein JXA85_04875, partial [Candidatus Woesearchaeota archaeon]|nr:hypothetical protein [Candidatus Woesearchaeota archaeon]